MKPLCTFDDLSSIDGTQENRVLDIKRDLMLGDRLAEYVQAGANGTAPLFQLILGAEEDSGHFDLSRLRPIKYPVNLQKNGPRINSFDEYKRHVNQCIQSHTTRYYEGMFEIAEIVVSDAGSVVVVRVPRSPLRPHQNNQNKLFYIRGDGNNRPMTDHEISEAFEQRNTRERGQRESVVPEVDNYDMPFVQPYSAHHWVTLSPGCIISTFDEHEDIDREVRLIGSAHIWIKVAPHQTSRQWHPTELLDIARRGLSLVPVNAPLELDLSLGRNQNGAAVWAKEEDSTFTRSAVQIFTNGDVQACDSRYLTDDCARLSLRGDWVRPLVPSQISKIITPAIQSLIKFSLEYLELRFPLQLDVGLMHVQDHRLAVAENTYGRITQESIFHGAILNDPAVELETRLIRPLTNQIWLAGGRLPPA